MRRFLGILICLWLFRVAEQEHQRASQLLCRRKKVKALEDLETEALIRKWGLDEEVFNC
jgi:hypothetical protein